MSINPIVPNTANLLASPQVPAAGHGGHHGGGGHGSGGVGHAAVHGMMHQLNQVSGISNTVRNAAATALNNSPQEKQGNGRSASAARRAAKAAAAKQGESAPPNVGQDTRNSLFINNLA